VIAPLCLGPALAAEGPRIVAPRAQELLVGDTAFVFEPGVSDPPVERIDLFANGRLIGSATPPEWRLTWDVEAKHGKVAVLAVAYANGRVAGKTALEYRAASVDEHEYVDLVLLYPVVTGSTGTDGAALRSRFVSGLTRGDFRVFEDGEEVDVEHFGQTVSSLTLVLLLDVSGSMSGRLGHVLVAASNFIDGLGANDEVALYTFDHATRKLIEPTRDHDQVKALLRDVSPGGGTALYDGILSVGASLKNVPGRKVLFMFSDGVDRHSFGTLDAAVQTLNRGNVIVYAVGFGDDDPGTDSRGLLRALARRSGGEAYFVKRSAALEGVFGEVLRDLQAQYELAFRPREGPSGERAIRVEVSGRSRQVRFRQSYAYVSPADRSR